MTDEKDLTPTHIRTQDTVRKVSASVSWYGRGSLATVKRETEVRKCAGCGSDFEEMTGSKFILCMRCRPINAVCECGHVSTVTRSTRSTSLCPHCGQSLDQTGKRREITTFSPAARLRLMRSVARCDERLRPAFLTITFPDSYKHIEDPRQWKAVLRRFEMRFARRWKNASYYWRIETPRRKSGKYVGRPVPHFHLLIFGVKSEVVFRFVMEVWKECLEVDDVLPVFHVRTIRSAAGVRAYTGKVIAKSGNVPGELGKDSQVADVERPGRYWGLHNKVAFQRFISQVFSLVLSDRESINVLRCFRKYAKVRGRNYRSLSVFLRGQWLKDHVPKIAVLTGGPWRFRATGRDIEIPFWKWSYDSGLLVPQLVDVVI